MSRFMVAGKRSVLFIIIAAARSYAAARLSLLQYAQAHSRSQTGKRERAACFGRKRKTNKSIKKQARLQTKHIEKTHCVIKARNPKQKQQTHKELQHIATTKQQQQIRKQKQNQQQTKRARKHTQTESGQNTFFYIYIRIIPARP